MKREDVEALRQKIAVADAGGWGFVSVRPQQLSALLDIAEAVMGAPVVPVELGIDVDGETYFYAEAAPEFDGQQVRLVRVGGGA